MATETLVTARLLCHCFVAMDMKSFVIKAVHDMWACVQVYIIHIRHVTIVHIEEIENGAQRHFEGKSGAERYFIVKNGAQRR